MGLVRNFNDCKFKTGEMDLIISKAKQENLNGLKSLLEENNLPTLDLAMEAMEFYLGTMDEEIVASIGLEKYGNLGLLRSLAVSGSFKNQKIGDRMVRELFRICFREGIEEFYLLTETAEGYFERYGFSKTDRIKVPELIRQTQEFREICPVSAVIMSKKVERRILDL